MQVQKYSDLNNKIILVTGGSRGIGKALCQALAINGAHVVFNYRGDVQKANELKQHFESLGGKATALPFDVTDSTKAKQELEAFSKEFGAISGLVNNAGISKDQLVLKLKEEDVSAILDTNLKSAIMLTSILSRGFLRAPSVSVVNISSVVGLMGNASQVAYSASKAGLLGLTKSFAKEMGSREVRCNAVCPGFIQTDMTEALDDKVKEAYLTEIPLNRFGKVEEVANLVCFLLSSASSYITGEVIKIDGGLYI